MMASLWAHLVEYADEREVEDSTTIYPRFVVNVGQEFFEKRKSFGLRIGDTQHHVTVVGVQVFIHVLLPLNT
jgi:hypothetical protein